MTRFRLLGEVTIDGRPLATSHASVLTVLSVLLINVNRVVRTEQLVDDLWGERLPAKPRDALYSYLSRLRAALPPDISVRQRSGGYVLQADPGSVDLHRFRALVATARADDQDRVATLTEALALWTGEPFTGLTAPGLEATRPALAAEHLAARLDLHDAQLRLGRHAELLPLLHPLAEEHPHDERLARQLLLTLTACGRQHDALCHYHSLRERLADELGVDPSPETRQVYQRILDGPPTTSAVPRELPARPGHFSARAADLAALTDATGEGPVVISGPGGVGKTALALSWAHDHLDLFPDGQLHLDLLGFTPSGEPVPAADALQRMLAGLGVTSVPDGVDARAALFRSTVADRRMLLVLDNAADSAQVTPLLPGTASCSVLITSRDRLYGVITAVGARALPLTTLSAEDSRLLLAERLGTARLDAEPVAVDELLTWCAGLPLALSAVAGHARMRPGFGLAVLADELRDESDRLQAMDFDDPVASLTVVLSSSYRALEPDHARTFGLLAAAPGPDISLECAKALTGNPRVRGDLRTLERVSLAEEHLPGRWRMHDLVRLYGQANAAPPDLSESLNRLTNHVLHTAAAADRLILSSRRPITLTPCFTVPLAFEDRAAAVAWFDAEHRTVLALQRVADDTTSWQLAWALDSYHQLGRRHMDDFVAALRHGLAAAQRLNDPTALLVLHLLLGKQRLNVNAFAEGERHLRAALVFAEAQNDRWRRVAALITLSHVLQQQGDPLAGLEVALDALTLTRSLGSPAWEAEAITTVGLHATKAGKFDVAEEHCREALTTSMALGDREAEAMSRATLGSVLHATGRHAEALSSLGAAAALFSELGSRFQEALAVEQIGDTLLALGRTAEAGEAYRRALPLVEQRQDSSLASRLRLKIGARSAQDR
ncbi:DNA-binding transcriptional activator of the SARP family [Lentzea albidocapillata subsp. violacea]|uniref:DNA-binding transcriptional activator of the SARP family n=1 Tax=Lentzea albidocapillata subsp. violacea TaxID=128104 RepID=A0A1G9K1U0_9PSEU|nr:AfsR/SARP family transcriptional regulator [Lentzea albidocapillata]SDL43870.1 DNA-binding transcriptional activator of the SARP family [Lentzea albidocapillata subsp. violacea]